MAGPGSPGSRATPAGTAGPPTGAMRGSTPRRVVDRRTVLAVRDGTVSRRPDALAGEEPMEIRVNGTPISVTMRTPGNDFELALGFCLTEGLVGDPEAVRAIRYCVGDGAQEYNVVDVHLTDPTPVSESLRRNVYTTSSCGLCGTASIDAVRKTVPDVSQDPLRLAPEVLARFPVQLRAAQRVFERTGGLHAAGAFDADGELICLREDVGRHNAVDKVIGWAATARRLPLAGRHADGLGAGRLRDRPESARRRVPPGGRGVSADEPGGGTGGVRRHDAGGLPTGHVDERLLRRRAGHDRPVTFGSTS